MGYSNNQGMVTPMKGAILVAARISDLDVANGSDCTVIADCAAGFIDSVEHDATGVYIVKLAAPYPPGLVVCIPKLDAAAATTDILTARYDQDSYDPDTGWLTINVSDDDDSGAPAAADGTSTDNLHLWMVFSRYTTLD